MVDSCHLRYHLRGRREALHGLTVFKVIRDDLGSVVLFEAEVPGALRVDDGVRAVLAQDEAIYGVDPDLAHARGAFLEHARAFAFGEGEDEKSTWGAPARCNATSTGVWSNSSLCAKLATVEGSGVSSTSSSPTPSTLEANADGAYTRLRPKGGRGAPRQPSLAARRAQD
jgi:hypothetical protein